MTDNVRGRRADSASAGAQGVSGPAPLAVEDLGDGRWRVTSATSSHIVELDPRSGALLCDSICKGFEYRGRCRHVDAVTRLENGEPEDGGGADSTDPAPDDGDAGPGLERDVPPPDDDDDDHGSPAGEDLAETVAPRSSSRPARTDNGTRRRRPAPWVWARVVKMCAAPALTPHHKLLWLEHYCWPGGCMVSASALGRRLAQSRKTIERDRTDLRRWGLLSQHDRGKGRTQLWHLELPPRCRPQGKRITDDDAESYAELLAAHINASAPRTTQSEVGSSQRPETRTSDSPGPRFEHNEGS